MLHLYVDKKVVDVNIFKFPAGESCVRVEDSEILHKDNVAGCITMKWEGNEDLLNLCFLVDAVRRKYRNIDLSLNIPYFPYARQDRVCNVGESLSIKVVADIINSLKFSRVYSQDPHSEVVAAVVDNLIVMDNVCKVKIVVDHLSSDVVLVSPDAGANKKVFGYAKALGGLSVIRADKTRNTKTGSITGTVVLSEHLGSTPILVIDDILDGGFTFIALAEELRKITYGPISLLITHGIFTKGVDIVADKYDNVFVVNNMFGTHPKLKEI